MLLYSLLHLKGYDLPLEQIKQFRQWGSMTPGHPERGVTPGVETTGKPDLIRIASGSEVSLIIAAQQKLQAQNIRTRVVSMPSWQLFDAQSKEYRDSVLTPSTPARLAVEAGVAQGWHRYVGDRGDVLSVERFGASAPGDVVMRQYGFTVENVCRRARALL